MGDWAPVMPGSASVVSIRDTQRMRTPRRSVPFTPHLGRNKAPGLGSRPRRHGLPGEGRKSSSQLLHLVGVFVRQVCLLVRIVLQVEQLDGFAGIRPGGAAVRVVHTVADDQLPVASADGPAGGGDVEQNDVMGGRLAL